MQLPKPFIAQMQEQLDQEFPAFSGALTQHSPTSIHFNFCKNYNWGENYKGVKWYNKGVYLSERPSFTLDPAFHAGAYYVQEASSMLVAEAVQQLFNLKDKFKVLDLCAAPGGKSTLLASLFSNESLLVSNEVNRSRYQVLDYNLTKWGHTNKLNTCQDVKQFEGLNDYFDLILVDAPCSGEGLFRKDPQAMAEWSPAHVSHCSARQKRILSDTIALLKPGGILLYSTCTYNDQENSDNASWLLQEYPLEEAALSFPLDWGIQKRKIGFQCYPHLLEGEGLYLAAFQKYGETSASKRSKSPKSFKYYERLSKAKQQELAPWITTEQELSFLQDEKANVIAIPAGLQEDLLQLSQHLRYFRMGTPIGTFKGRDLVPAGALALSHLIQPEFPAISVDREEALRFLKKEVPNISNPPLGWHLLQYQNLNLGWIKGLKGRINNYYPKEWRIRMSL